MTQIQFTDEYLLNADKTRLCPPGHPIPALPSLSRLLRLSPAQPSVRKGNRQRRVQGSDGGDKMMQLNIPVCSLLLSGKRNDQLGQR